MYFQLFLQRKFSKQSLAPTRNKQRGPVHRLRFQLLSFLTFFGVFPLLALSVVNADVNVETKSALQTNLTSADLISSLPASLGKIIYRFNPESSKQLYIVGISHRAPFAGGNNAGTTVQTQSELYRIGEWLKRNRGLDLLLPEGFFNPDRALSANNFVINVDLPKEGRLALDDATLEAKLSDQTRFVNAEMLLMKNFHMQVGQVEDRGLYDEVYNSLFRLKTGMDGSQEHFEAVSELGRLQKNRTAFILQKAPAVIDDKFAQGKIEERQAMLTIGLNHLQEIIQYINKNEINMDFRAGEDTYASQLNLVKEGFGITIIVPQVLASDNLVMEMTGLAGMIMASQEATTL